MTDKNGKTSKNNSIIILGGNIMSNQEKLKNIGEMIKKVYKTNDVKEIVIDDEFQNVTATINRMENVDCGYVEDYNFAGRYYHEV